MFSEFKINNAHVRENKARSTKGDPEVDSNKDTQTLTHRHTRSPSKSHLTRRNTPGTHILHSLPSLNLKIFIVCEDARGPKTLIYVASNLRLVFCHNQMVSLTAVDVRL